MIFFIYNAWQNNPWLLANYTLITLGFIVWLGVYLRRAYQGPHNYHDNPIIGQLGEVVRWDVHDKRIKVKDVFWQVQASNPTVSFKTGDWVQVVGQDNLVLTIAHPKPTE